MKMHRSLHNGRSTSSHDCYPTPHVTLRTFAPQVSPNQQDHTGINKPLGNADDLLILQMLGEAHVQESFTHGRHGAPCVSNRMHAFCMPEQ